MIAVTVKYVILGGLGYPAGDGGNPAPPGMYKTL